MQTSTPPLRPMPLEQEAGSHGMGLIIYLTTVASIGGFLFGYDTAVISGAIGFLKTRFGLNDMQEGWAVASAIVGCIPGAMFAGIISDRLGRKKALILAAVLYAVSAITSAIPRTLLEFIIARFIGGVGIGISSMTCPVYIAEISPERHRGRLTALFQLGIVVGMLVVYFVNLLIQRMGDVGWNTEYGWRWMLGSETLPAVVFVLLLLAVPESPRWLALNGRQDAARSLLVRLMGPAAAKREMEQIVAVSYQSEGRFGEVFHRQYHRPLIIAVGLAALAQFSGINSIIYYAPEVFKLSGAAQDAAFAATVWVGVVNVVFTFVAIAYVDRLGRKPLLAIGAAVQTVCLASLGWMFARGEHGAGVLLFVLGYIAAFATAMGPIPWIIIAEIFPGRIRGRASSIGVFTIWVSCFMVAQTFPSLRTMLGPSRTFYMYAVCSLVSLVFVLALIPETKGKTLEEIETSWKSGRNTR